MKKVFIKYNPYNLETEIKVDGRGLQENSRLVECTEAGRRLQEWVEELPQILVDEFNDTDFEVTFHGTMLDYEDLTEVFTNAINSGKLTASIEPIPAKETKEKEGLIDAVFEEIQKGPFEELRSSEIINAFEHAKSSDFEVCVVATMSAGKSTLINSMLGTKLMPSKQEACTAIITRIKDNDDSDRWQAKVYSKDNQLIETHENLTYETMVRLNSDENVSVIKAAGDIPFVTAEDVSLVLIDTPGPNNSRDPEHRRVQSDFLSKSSKSLVLYIMESTFGSDDDNALLSRVADSMKVGGKQSKDRFIFVVNKMDDHKAEDGEMSQKIARVRRYLKSQGIENPNLFPAAALPALNIRLTQNGVELDRVTVMETNYMVYKLNSIENLHLEDYATLPASVSGRIKNDLQAAQANNDAEAQALIHTGVPSIEAAIRQYVQKYAKTAKVKNIADTFTHKLDELDCFEKTKQELAKNKEDCERIAAQIDIISQNVSDGKIAKQFQKAVNDTAAKVADEAKDIKDDIIVKFQPEIRAMIESVKELGDITPEEAEAKAEVLREFAEKLQPEFQNELDRLIRDNLLSTSQRLLDEYKKKLASLTEEVGTVADIKIDSLKLMSGSLENADEFSVKNLIERVEGKEWVENTDKKWYKPWTWFQKSGWFRTTYTEVVHADELAQMYLSPIEEKLSSDGAAALEYAHMQSEKIVKAFNAEFERLDKVLKKKLDELESYAVDKDKAEERIKETQKRLDWLEDIKNKVNSILEI